MTKAQQLDMFTSADECRQLQAENACLKTRLENAKAEFRKLREALQHLHQDLESTERECALWKSQAELYKMLITSIPHGAPAQRTAPSKADLTTLLTLCHPDKWSQGQPATELAHELTVTINALRERRGGTACS